ncbi:unnamed protein product, partial [Coregonus sp. 'balchen']
CCALRLGWEEEEEEEECFTTGRQRLAWAECWVLGGGRRASSGAFPQLLDGTMDLDERRLIRSAIRELRRREIEDMEAALASKRFRPKHLNQNDDKENQLTNRSDSGDSLNVLAVKLQTIQDIEELTGLLRGATAYEERKLIRAAIRRLRDEEQQGEYRGGGEGAGGRGEGEGTERRRRNREELEVEEEEKEQRGGGGGGGGEGTERRWRRRRRNREELEVEEEEKEQRGAGGRGGGEGTERSWRRRRRNREELEVEEGEKEQRGAGGRGGGEGTERSWRWRRRRRNREELEVEEEEKEQRGAGGRGGGEGTERRSAECMWFLRLCHSVMEKDPVRLPSDSHGEESLTSSHSDLICTIMDSASMENVSILTQDTESESLGERERIKSQIRELRSHQTQQGRELQRTGSNSGMVLVLDPLVREEVSGPLLTRPKIWDPVTSSELDVVLSHSQRSDSTASDRSQASRPRLDSGASEKSLGLGSAFRTRVDSGASEKSLGLGSAFRTRVDSGASEKSLGLGSAFRTRVDSGASEKSLGLGSAFRTRVDSGASDRSQCSVHRGRLDSGASESRIRPRLDSGTSDSSVGPPAPLGSETSDSAGLLSRKRLDSGTSDLSVSVSSVGRGRVEEPEVTMSSSSSSTDSEAESTNHLSAQPRLDRSSTNRDQPDRAVLSRKASGSHSGLLNGSSKGRGDIQEQKVQSCLIFLGDACWYDLLCLEISVSLTCCQRESRWGWPATAKHTGMPEKKETVVLAPFGRVNSVRDRMRKFTEPSPSPSDPFLKRGSQSLRNGTAPSARVLGRANELSEGRAAGPANQTAGTTAVSISTPTDRHGRPHVGSTSYSSSSSSSENLVQCKGTIQSGGVATKDLQTAAQSMSTVGGAKQPAEKLLHSSGISKEDKTPGSQGEADPDMKTFLTIEIKDGRTISTSSSSSSSSSRGNLASMTPMAPRITTNAMGQRAAPPLHANISLEIPLESLLPWATRDATGT